MGKQECPVNYGRYIEIVSASFHLYSSSMSFNGLINAKFNEKYYSLQFNINDVLKEFTHIKE